jgi:hypothetical protein
MRIRKKLLLLVLITLVTLVFSATICTMPVKAEGPTEGGVRSGVCNEKQWLAADIVVVAKSTSSGNRVTRWVLAAQC